MRARSRSSQAIDDDAAGGYGWATGAVVMAAVLFNAVLAVVNGHVVRLGPASVIACEATILLCAHLLVLPHLRARMLPWYAFLVPIVAFALLRGWALGSFEARFVRDVALVPTFLVLGMTFPRSRLPHLLVTLHAVVLAGMLLEWAFLDAYANLFAIKDYYINTRGATEDSFWNTASTLFVSATRPDDRFFSFVNWHRMSSVFLEPVSLGNYCIFVAASVFAFPALLRRWQVLFLAVGTALLLVGCDGRLATVTILIIGVVSLVARFLPVRASLLFPLAVLALAVFAVVTFGWKGGSDNFPGRIAHTIDLLGRFTLQDYMGLSDSFLNLAVDSGLSYLILTQSLAITVLLWLCVALLPDEGDASATRFKAAAATYIALSMLVSFSFLSIKTAAPLWFTLGALQPARQTRHAPRPLRIFEATT